MIIKNKKICRVLIGGLIVASLLVGCTSSVVKRDIALGKDALNNKEYSKAITDFQNALKEDNENKEAINLLNITKGYENAKKSFDKGNLKEASDKIEILPKDYMNYKIKDDVDKLKDNIKIKKEAISKINNELKDVSKLIKEKDLNKAKDEINKIDLENATKDQKDILDNYNRTISNIIEDNNKEKILKETKENEKSPIKNNTKPYKYINENLGFSITFPAKWSGHYRVQSDKTGIHVYFKAQKQPNVNVGEYLIFEIQEVSPVNNENGMFTLGKRRYIYSKGRPYIICKVSNGGLEKFYPEINRIRQMDKEAEEVANTIKALN